MNKSGTVYLVGAGPGDASLLTLRGAELLRRADVVIYDALVNLSLLQLAPATAEIVFGGRRAKDAHDNRPDVIDQLIAKAREGKTVVRLKGGDPYVFGRGARKPSVCTMRKFLSRLCPEFLRLPRCPTTLASL